MSYRKYKNAADRITFKHGYSNPLEIVIPQVDYSEYYRHIFRHIDKQCWQLVDDLIAFAWLAFTWATLTAGIIALWLIILVKIYTG